MKLQAITFVAVVTSFSFSTSADAGKFDLVREIKTAQVINHQVNHHGKITRPSPNPPVTTFPIVRPIKPICKPKPPVVVYPIHPVHPIRPIHPVHPPVCKKPPVCKPPVNRPPVRCLSLKLINNAEADVYFVLNQADDFVTLTAGDKHWTKTKNPAPHHISYHNGQEMVEYELDPNGTYSFEWQGEVLQLLEVQV
jgi:hypothetical protein